MLNRKVEAISHGAATIVNAIATGKGAAIGVDLWTKASVQLTDNPLVIEGRIQSDPNENPGLIEATVKRVFTHFHIDTCGAKVETHSNIPIARGLKSSSVAGNAVALATVTALNRSLDDLDVVKLGVDGAVNAKVTITGAFDDACASYFGGIIVTDNQKREIVKRFKASEEIAVLFHVPREKRYTGTVHRDKMTRLAPFVKLAYAAAVKGNFWSSLTLNGLLYSSALGYDSSIALAALAAGALGAGLSGTGPAVTAIVTQETMDPVKDAWQAYEGIVLETRVNHDQARVVI